ncbi:DUF4179 domain-containing protein [Filibacter tadaridae]|uniref:DUF4179 domain-containing protein n=1 Tax=Filibacter tadaridae TaxID=2483811 RepID=A0A3P5WLG7_9BACL|nr:DUF4179 domain-containing protein [Filibacter tadaridae]VDC22385.1 hypothetical protein FILTAD_00731 [Filibacter tadaridae]
MTNSYKDWLDLDIENIEPMNLSDSKKASIKNDILATRKKKKLVRLRHLLAASIIVVSTVATIGFTFPTLAAQIPFLQNIISYFNDEDTIYENYGDFATDISQLQTSNGVSVMIENAVFDGTSLTVSYAVETEIDLGTSPRMSTSFDIKGASGMGATGSLQKISDSTYVGLERITPHFNKAVPDELEVSWQPLAFKDYNANTEVKGDWQFNFKLPELDSKLQLINQSVTNHGVTMLINSFEKNGMSTVIRYEQFVEADILKQWPNVIIQFDAIQDNLGNTYIVEGNGGKSTDDGLSYKLSGTIKSLDPNAQSLKIVPTIYFSLGSGKGMETKEMEPILIDLR